MIPETLSQLYPADTPLSQVSPDFRGMRLHKWRLLKISEQAAAYVKSLPPDTPKPLAEKREWRPHDSYGIKGMLGDNKRR